MKKFILSFIALCLIFSALGVNVYANDNYIPTDTYILNYSNNDIAGYEDYDAKRLYASDHYAGLYVDEDGDGVNEADWNWTCFSVLNMINTSKLSIGGSGAYASIPSYCVDAITDGEPGHAYRRVNLEESTYFSADTAGRLRAIILNSFPYIADMRQIEDAVNSSLASDVKVTNLSESEVISATQAAIWTLVNNIEVYAPYLGTGGYYRESEMVDTSVFRQEETEYTKDNITLLYNYLIALSPISPIEPLVTSASFANSKANLTETENGYTAKIETDITACVYGDTSLTLTAVVNGSIAAAVPVKDGLNSYTMEISGINETDTVVLAVDGVQHACDVFLFDPLNGRGASQTMAGYDTSALPVHAQISLSPEILSPEQPNKDPIIDQPEESLQESPSKDDTIKEDTSKITNPNTNDKYISVAVILLLITFSAVFIPRKNG